MQIHPPGFIYIICNMTIYLSIEPYGNPVSDSHETPNPVHHFAPQPASVLQGLRPGRGDHNVPGGH